MASIEKKQLGWVRVLTLNRPDKFNSFNREMALLLQQELDDATAASDTRVIVLTGSGKAFCAGQDLGELTGADAPGFEVILKEHYNPVVQRIRSITKPVIAAVNGVAAGAGANIALACDITVASETASFIQAFSKIGLIPDSGGTWTLPRLVGLQRATALMMLGDKVQASEAVQMGMIYACYPAEHFETQALELACRLAELPPKGIAFTKMALQASVQHSFSQQLELEDQLQYQAAHTRDYREGVQAFLEKRKPQFTGE